MAEFEVTLLSEALPPAPAEESRREPAPPIADLRALVDRNFADGRPDETTGAPPVAQPAPRGVPPVQAAPPGARSGRVNANDGPPASDLIGVGAGAGAAGRTATARRGERLGGAALPIPPGSLWGVGKPETSRSFVYVLDRSGSMQDSFHLLQRELISAIHSLSSEQSFNVIWFSAGPCEMLSPSLLPASADNKQFAFDAIRRIIPGGQTQPLDAVRRGLAQRPDVLYLLSDGDFADQNEPILDLLRATPREKRPIVHTILFLFDAGLAGRGVLRQIAELGGGTFKHVTEDEVGLR